MVTSWPSQHRLALLGQGRYTPSSLASGDRPMLYRLNWLLGLVVVAAIALSPLAYYNYRSTTLRGFRVVEDGVLYRSGQLSPKQLERVLNEYGIRTVITLREQRDETKPDPTVAEEKYCHERGITYVKIPKHGWGDDEIPKADAAVDAFLKAVNDPANQPVLVHCFAGIHRTGAHCALYRMEKNGWTRQEAMAEMKAFGYRHLDEEQDVLEYLERADPASHQAH